MKKLNITIEFKNDKVEKALETLKGYCQKHSDCDGDCRFYDKEEN